MLARLFGIVLGLAFLAMLAGCGGALPPATPRVLLIGDSISLGYRPYVPQYLAGAAVVHHAGVNAGSTANGLAHLRDWVGATPWQVIHFNFGLHDLALDATEQPAVPLAQYAANLRAIVRTLRDAAPGARLIWASTTPVPDAPLTPPRRNADVLAYNAEAAQVMAELQVPVDDLYTAITPSLATLQQPRNVHFTALGYSALGAAVARSIRAALAIKLP
jgi:lysophospholipase L1-like esterase